MERLMTIKELANYLGVSRKTVYFFMYKKGLPSIKVGHRLIRFRKEDIDNWLKQRIRNLSI